VYCQSATSLAANENFSDLPSETPAVFCMQRSGSFGAFGIVIFDVLRFV
jgi:hypothetical protein